MTDTPQENRQRTHYRAKSGRAEVRAPDDEGEPTRIRMPVSSSAQDRDGDEFSAEGLADMAAQLNADDERIPMFLNHGRGGSDAYYGLRDMVGHWDSAELETDGDVQILYAEGTLYDGRPGAEDAQDLLERDAPVGASVGFRAVDEDGNYDDGFVFHETDLLEISLVGIPSNPETVNAASPSTALAKAVGEASTDFDVDAFVREFRDAVDSEGHQARDDMSNDDDTGDDAGTKDDEGGIDAAEFRETMLEEQKQQTETLSVLVESLKEDDDGEDDDDDDDESGEDEDDDGENGKSTGDGTTKTVTVNGEEKSIDEHIEEYRSALEEARADGEDTVEIADPKSKLFEADEDDQTEKQGGDQSADEDEPYGKYGI